MHRWFWLALILLSNGAFAPAQETSLLNEGRQPNPGSVSHNGVDPSIDTSSNDEQVPRVRVGQLAVDEVESQINSPIDAKDIVAASGWASDLGLADWMGPLAPVALSPFFGVTILSGLALWGPDWATDNAILGHGGALANPTLFWVLLAFTLLTSLPRLTKVSKPFVQAVDRIETYAVIIIMLLVKCFATGGVEDPSFTPPVAVIQLGVISFTAETLLAIAMVINILVINSVKFFFEFLIWLTPIPFLDAAFEIANKSTCAALMALYAFSPTLATGVNLILLVVAAIAMRWISRRVRFYRTMTLDPILSRLWSGFGTPRKAELVVFPSDDFGPFKAKSRLMLARCADSAEGWVVSDATWWHRGSTYGIASSPPIRATRGWVTNSLWVTDESGADNALKFSRRYDQETLDALLENLGINAESPSDETLGHQAEFA